MTDSIDLRLTNDPAELERLARCVDEFCRSHHLPPRVAFALNLALEEAVSNVIVHGYDDAGTHEIGVRMSVADRMVRAEITDDGRPFDPLQAAPPNLTAGVAERPIGGLGVLLIKRVMDEVEYRVVAGCNCLTLAKRIP